MSRHARRGHSRFTKSSSLQLMTTTGNPAMEITLFAYRPKDKRFWWAEWYQLRSHSDPDIPANFFPILTPHDLSWQPGEQQVVTVIPRPDDWSRKMELVLIDDIHQKVVTRIPFQYELPVTHVPVKVGDWRSSLYRLVVEGGCRGKRSEPETQQRDCPLPARAGPRPICGANRRVVGVLDQRWSRLSRLENRL
jgi:hypothetical protein